LSGLMDGAGACKGSVWWFTPGTYYFDFHNQNVAKPTAANPLLNSTAGDTWTMKDGQLLAGRPPVDAAGNVVPPSQPVTMPGACENPIKTTTAQGVQFIFGGDSQLAVKAGDIEICGTYHSTRLPLAVYGVTGTSDESSTSATGVASITPGQFTTVSATDISTVNNSFATWTHTAASAAAPLTGMMTLNGYTTPTTIPAGSILTAVTATVNYKNTGNASTDKRNLTINVGGTAFTSPDFTFQSGFGAHTETIDFWGNGKSALATFVHANGYSSPSVGYSATVKHPGTESVDAIQVSLAFTPPAFRSEANTVSEPANCIATLNSCAAISTATNYAGAFYIQGTTYMPLARVDLTLNNITAQVLRFGVIARSLSIKETGSISYNGPVIEIPDNSPGLGIGSTIIYLTVYDCPGVSTCSSSGRLRLRSRVLVKDAGAPVAGNRTMYIQSWAVQR
jgi:hypothetical protein